MTGRAPCLGDPPCGRFPAAAPGGAGSRSGLPVTLAIRRRTSGGGHRLARWPPVEAAEERLRGRRDMGGGTMDSLCSKLRGADHHDSSPASRDGIAEAATPSMTRSRRPRVRCSRRRLVEIDRLANPRGGEGCAWLAPEAAKIGLRQAGTEFDVKLSTPGVGMNSVYRRGPARRSIERRWTGRLCAAAAMRAARRTEAEEDASPPTAADAGRVAGEEWDVVVLRVA